MFCFLLYVASDGGKVFVCLYVVVCSAQVTTSSCYQTVVVPFPRLFLLYKQICCLDSRIILVILYNILEEKTTHILLWSSFIGIFQDFNTSSKCNINCMLRRAGHD
jgi:hypothetical protein